MHTLALLASGPRTRPRWSNVSIRTALAAVAACALLMSTPAYGVDICRTQRNQPRGCFDLQLARKYEGWERWKEAEQEYIQAGRVGAPCVRKEALDALDKLNNLQPIIPVSNCSDQPCRTTACECSKRQPNDSNFEFDLGEHYRQLGASKQAEEHYASAGKDQAASEWPKTLEEIDVARQQKDFNFELALAGKYLGLGASREAEQRYSAAGKEGTEPERERTLMGIDAARGQEAFAFEIALARKYEELGAFEDAEQHYASAGKEGTTDERHHALEKINEIRKLRSSELDPPRFEPTRPAAITRVASPRPPSLLKVPVSGHNESHPDFEVALANQYFEEGAWKEAETHYSLAAKDRSDTDRRQNALDAIKLVRGKAGLDWPRLDGFVEWANNWNEKADHLLGFGSYFIFLAGIILLFPPFCLRCSRYIGGIEIAPSLVSREVELDQLVFAFAHVRDMARWDPGSPLADSVDLIFLPSDPDVIPDTFELAGFRLSFGAVLRRLIKAKVRVTCYWRIGSPAGELEAIMERRRWLWGYKKGTVPAMHSNISPDPGDLRDRQLAGFVGEALGKAQHQLSA
jgi:hypothetical protein